MEQSVLRTRLDRFVSIWNGKRCDFDKVYGAQCVDLFRQYCKDVLEIPHTGSVEGARDLFINYEQMPSEVERFKRCVGRPGYGDCVVWDASPSNRWGHVAICIYGTDKEVVVFQQLGFTGNDYSHLSVRTYGANYLGFLAPKNVSRVDALDEV